MFLRFADFNDIELIEPDNKIIRHDSESCSLSYDSIENISNESEISESLRMFEKFLFENL
jgi:hypothetical protein